MNIDHVCIVVSNMDESLKLYRDVLGLKVIIDRIIPDGPGPRTYFDQKTLNDIFQTPNAKSHFILLTTDEGALIELEQPIIPSVQKLPKEQLAYGYVGISEIALRVNNIVDWFNLIKSAGYKTQTEYIWQAAGIVKSFLFFDPDGNMIQLSEYINP